MQCFIGESKLIKFIGKCGGDGPAPGQVAWDANTPWDNNIYWS